MLVIWGPHLEKTVVWILVEFFASECCDLEPLRRKEVEGKWSSVVFVFCDSVELSSNSVLGVVYFVSFYSNLLHSPCLLVYIPCWGVNETIYLVGRQRWWKAGENRLGQGSIWADILQCVRDSCFLVATQVRASCAPFKQQRAELNPSPGGAVGYSPHNLSGFFQVHFRVHLTYIATYCPHPSLTEELLLRVAEGRWGRRGHTTYAKGNCECSSLDFCLESLIWGGSPPPILENLSSYF